MLVDANGKAEVDDGLLTMFFNARDAPLETGGLTVIGRATSSDGGTTWQVDPIPALSDGPYSAAGSALVLDDRTVALFYTFDTTAGFRMATSTDGGTFCPIASPPFFQPPDVGCTRIGLPYVTKALDGWVMVFEGLDPAARRFSIFGARSGNLRDWNLLNNGRSLLPPAGDWDRHGQANPSLHRDGDGLFLLYNGSPDPMEWDVGLARSKDPTLRTWETLKAPILMRHDDESWSATRLEGARPFPAGSNLSGLLYFGTPTADSFLGGTIGIASPLEASLSQR